ncbi:MAG: hypothetical protein DWQ07_07525 [Chloroflexi bacterium]|nr:MAG: hypothetical protein DWQ07_07525 [Chloroflexota bacterium]MBL1195448.1 hypothetical protein [Chloroflexota bacterium]NOH12731.1 hypothetical protein [Chloroflexota bacterium]
MSEKYTIEVKKRPWYEWLLWALWLLVSLFTLQNAVASGTELEPRAATIFWIVFVILVLGGGIVWYIRRDN